MSLTLFSSASELRTCACSSDPSLIPQRRAFAWQPIKRRPAKEPTSHTVLATLNPELTSSSKVGRSSTAAIVTGGYHTGRGSLNQSVYQLDLLCCFRAKVYFTLQNSENYVNIYYCLFQNFKFEILCNCLSPLFDWMARDCYHSK